MMTCIGSTNVVFHDAPDSKYTKRAFTNTT